MSNVQLTRHVILPNLLQQYKSAERIALRITQLPAAMASTTSKRSNTDVAAAAAKLRRGKINLPTVQEEQHLPEVSSSSA